MDTKRIRLAPAVVCATVNELEEVPEMLPYDAESKAMAIV